jgi:hypothetical protein
MDIGRAFSYVFDDEQWITVILIGGLLQLIPIFGQIVLIGFMLEAARNVANGNPRPLPRWSNIGDKFSQGLAGLVIGLVYSLPVILLAILFACVAVGGAAAAGEDGGEAIGGLIGLLSLCLVPLMILLSLVVQPLMLAAYGRYLQTGSLGAALRVGDAWLSLRADLGGWLVLWLLQLVCGFVGGLGTVALGIGVLFTYVYGQAVFGHLLGQHMRRSGQPATMDYSPPAPPPAF